VVKGRDMGNNSKVSKKAGGGSKRAKPVAAKAGFTKSRRRYDGGGKLK
jgi:hypothetical protein